MANHNKSLIYGPEENNYAYPQFRYRNRYYNKPGILNNKISYLPRIDGLRFLAISLVLLEHYAIVIGGYLDSGKYGVSLFFVISGFLITSILIKKEDTHSKKIYLNFLGRRVLRIFPIYFLTVFIVYFSGQPVVHQYLLYFVTYTYNYAWAYYGIPVNPLMHFWSLCVEEQFYFMYPVIFILLRKQLNYLLYFLLLLIVIANAQNLFNLFGHPQYNYVGLLTNMSPLGLGCLGAILAARGKIPEWVFDKKMEIICFLLLLLSFFRFKFEIKFLIWGFANLYLVLKAALSNFKFAAFDKMLLNKRVIYIGQISYGLYVYHLPIGMYLDQYFLPAFWHRIPFSHFGIFSKIEYNNWVFKIPVYTTISILAAHLSFNYFEKPILRLKDRFFQ